MRLQKLFIDAILFYVAKSHEYGADKIVINCGKYFTDAFLIKGFGSEL